MDHQVMHNPTQQMFFIEYEGAKALLSYSIRDGGIIDFTNTYVPPELRGGTLAARLAEAGLSYAVERGYRIAASCSYIRHYIATHPRYHQYLAVSL
ncbi:MAG: N-acetyltransferase [Desulfobacterota bacterium]|nr:N-acetyltransferase [Thermodesulfobacteriota bacterium]